MCYAHKLGRTISAENKKKNIIKSIPWIYVQLGITNDFGEFYSGRSPLTWWWGTEVLDWLQENNSKLGKSFLIDCADARKSFVLFH